MQLDNPFTISSFTVIDTIVVPSNFTKENVELHTSILAQSCSDANTIGSTSSADLVRERLTVLPIPARNAGLVNDRWAANDDAVVA